MRVFHYGLSRVKKYIDNRARCRGVLILAPFESDYKLAVNLDGEIVETDRMREVVRLETGKQADFLICTDGYANKRVFLAGKEL